MADELEEELPESVRRELDDARDEDGQESGEKLRQGVLDLISKAIAEKRDEAVTARRSSGVENVWWSAEEAYIGIDDANRNDYKDNGWEKPTSMDGPVETESTGKGEESKKSTVFIRMTARYVDAGAAKLGEILLPEGDKAFSFEETPVPELEEAKDDDKQVLLDNGLPLMRPLKPGELAPVGAAAGVSGPAPAAGMPAAVSAPGTAPAGAGASVPTVPITVADFAEENINIARKKAKKAERRIYDWMVESQWNAEMRKVIFDAARIGVGVIKAPTPKMSNGMKVVKGDAGVKLDIVRKLQPAVQWKDPWNIYPDPTCGENIQNGDYIFERDFFSQKQLRKLKSLPGYIHAAIDKVIDEGPGKITNVGDADGDKDEGRDKKSKKRFDVWFYYGSLARDEFNALRTAGNGVGETDTNKDEVYAIVTMVNDTVIRCVFNPLDTGDFPYHAVPWQRRPGTWAGIGVCEQLKEPQRILNAGMRSLLNNAGAASGVQIVLDRGAIEPSDGNYLVTPNKVWYLADDATVNDVRQAFMAVVIPNTTDPLIKIVELALRMAEESTSIPLITQGESGPTQPDTFGATQLQNSNANQLLRSIGYSFDDYITEPVVRQYYEWLLLDPKVPDDEKGDFKINAHGSASLVERAIQDQTILQIGAVVKDPTYGLDPKKWAKLMLKSKKLNPIEIAYTPEEQKALDSRPPPEDPRITAAKIMAAPKQQQLQLDDKNAGEDRKLEQLRITTDTDRDTAWVQAQDRQNQNDHEARMEELRLKERLATLDYASRHNLTIEQVKGKLTDTAMRLNVQKELAMAGHAKDLHMHHVPAAETPDGTTVPQVIAPAVEPAGTAPPGEAFQK